MELITFIKGLITEGSVSVKGALTSFTAEDIEQTKDLLHQYYQEDILEMPSKAPAFSAEAAIWAAQYFYQSVQLTVLRDAGEEIIQEHLTQFPGDVTPENIYSVDLVLRYLPSLFGLAKGLAPGDLLVQELRKIAIKWPFSSVGTELDETVNHDIIFLHPSLRQAYIDRIIEQKDIKRINSVETESHLLETTGEYLPVIWPDFETELKPTNK